MLAPAEKLPTPLGLLAELTHRCPLGCPYCSNPLKLDPRADELDTATWARVLAYMSVIAHFESFAKGVLDSKDAVFYVTVIFLGLFFTARSWASLPRSYMWR